MTVPDTQYNNTNTHKEIKEHHEPIEIFYSYFRNIYIIEIGQENMTIQ